MRSSPEVDVTGAGVARRQKADGGSDIGIRDDPLRKEGRRAEINLCGEDVVYRCRLRWYQKEEVI